MNITGVDTSVSSSAIKTLMAAETDYIVILDRYASPIKRGVHAVEIAAAGGRFPFHQNAVGLFREDDSDQIIAWAYRVCSRVSPDDIDAQMLFDYIGDQVLPLGYKEAWRNREPWLVDSVLVFSYMHGVG